MTLIAGPLEGLIQANPEKSSEQLTLIFIYFILAFIVYGITVYFIRKNKWKLTAKRQITLLFFLVILVRLPLLLADPQPALSTDIYRYWWDGKVQAEGYNPYKYSPKDFPEESLKQGYFHLINHPEYPTIYGPFTQMVFYLSYKTGLDLLGIKLSILIFDLLTIFILLKWLKKKAMAFENVIIYAFNPLILIEYYNGGHSDAYLAFFITLTLYLFENGKRVGSLISLAFLTLTKYIGILFLPFYFKKIKWYQFVIYFLIVGLFYYFYFDENMFTSLKTYSQYWKFNASFFYLLYKPGIAESIVKIIIAAVCAVIYFIKWREILQDSNKFVINFLFIISLIIVVSPVVYPWYLSMILPIMVIYFYRPWVFFSAFVFLSYFVLYDYFRLNKWEENLFVILLEYIPFYGLILYDYFKKK